MIHHRHTRVLQPLDRDQAAATKRLLEEKLEETSEELKQLRQLIKKAPDVMRMIKAQQAYDRKNVQYTKLLMELGRVRRRWYE